LRAALNRRSLPAKVLFELGGLYFLAISPQTYAEAKDVLNRPELRAKFASLTDEIVTATLAVLSNGQQVNLEQIPSVARDPKDNIFLATALESKAQYIVSEDNDLLVFFNVLQSFAANQERSPDQQS